MARVLPRNLFGSCYILLLTYIIFRKTHVGFLSTISWCLLVFILVSVCVNGVHNIIEREKHRSAPEILKLSEEMVHSIHTLVNERHMCLNKRQCLDLSSKLSRTIHNIHKLERQCGFSDSVFRPSLEHLYQVLLKAKVLVNDCSNENWIGASVFQMQNESSFQVILMDVGFCYHAIYQQAKLSMSGEWKNVEMEDLRASSTFKPASTKDVDEDREELRGMLEDLVDARNYGSGWLFRVYYFLLVRFSKRLRLAEYLLVKLHCVAQQTLWDGLQLSKPLLWEEESEYSWTWGRKVPLATVGAGASGVFKTEWLNIPCAKKCNIPEPYFMKEAGILSHVNYPNIIKFICCGEKWGLGKDFIVLELMEMSLSDLIKEKEKEGIPFSYAVAVDIMAQIGRGMCYLHALRVAHRDLKPANVVLNVLTSPQVEATYHVKLVDFGTSKTQVDPSKTTSTENGFGTLTHKAPEVRRLAPAKSEGDRKWRAVWFKADVWSFAVVCLEVLSLKLRKFRDEEDEDLKSMIPRDCPPALVALLEDCLQAHPRARPDFFDVCFRLEALRHRLLRPLPNSEQDSSLDFSHYEFIGMRLKEHFYRQTAGVVADDEEMGVLIAQTSHVEEQAHQETFRMDEAVYSTTVEDRDLEIWSKQPGNEVFRKALEEWREECEIITERVRMMKDQQLPGVKQCISRNELGDAFIIFMFPICLAFSTYQTMSYWWVASWSLVLLVAFFKIYWAFYVFWCLRRFFKAHRRDLNKRMVLNDRIVMLTGRGSFSPSRMMPRNMTRRAILHLS